MIKVVPAKTMLSVPPTPAGFVTFYIDAKDKLLWAKDETGASRYATDEEIADIEQRYGKIRILP